MSVCVSCVRVVKEVLAGEPSTRLEGAGAIDVPALLDREYRLNLYCYTQVPAGFSTCSGACTVVVLTNFGFQGGP